MTPDNCCGPAGRVHASRQRPGDTPPPVEVTCGPMLCRLRVWSEREWAELPDRRRPAASFYAPGLGWVGAVPVDCMN